MWERIHKLWTITDVRNKILFTLALLLLYRILASIAIPLTQEQQLRLTQIFNGSGNQNLGQLLGLLDTFSGASWEKFSIVALGVYPYITATIVMNLLTPIIPTLQQMQTEGESGRQRFNQITRLIAVPLAFLQAFSQAALFVREGVLDATTFNLFGPSWLHTLAILLTLTTGTMILVWFGELITNQGIGNGLSLIILAGILSSLPNYIHQLFTAIASPGGNSSSSIVSTAVFLLIGLVMVVSIIYLYQGQRRITIHYPTKRQVGRQMLLNSSQKSYIPMQINSTGMIPLIFASSMLILPLTISQYLTTSPFTWLANMAQWCTTYIFNTTLWYYWLLNFLLIVAFTYFYAHVQWRQQHIPENLQKQGAVITGYRPGEQTSKYLTALLNRLTLSGALGLAILATLPFFIRIGVEQPLNSAKLLIAIGVILDTIRQLDSHMVMRNYSGFLP